RIHVLELALVSQALHDPEPDLPAVEIAVVTKHVRLDYRLGRIAEGGPHADVRDARVHDPVYRRHRRVYAVGGQQLVGRLQVRGREAELAAAMRPGHDEPIDVELVTEQRTRFVHAPFRHEAADARAADDELLV